jgi:predicted adenine nucleotide alpha hydrolase (AANH) superfamily ATPase
MSKLLVHCCCVHCSAYTLNYWREQGYEVTAYWYNPNIHPFLEHQRRLEALKSMVEKEGIPLVIEPGYEMDRYFRAVVGDEEERCRHCYRIRLEHVAGYAAAHGYDAFTSSLLISPQQNHDLIVEVAMTTEASSGVKFAYTDLRKRYSDSRRLTKPLELYRQQYCGCLYSEFERYRDESAGPK